MKRLLLVNLGTPESPTPEAVKPYLRQFLSDRRVVELPPILWQPILNLFVLRRRPEQSAEKYRKIWTAEGSPLMVHTRRQAELLQAALGKEYDVRFAMRYGSPSISEVLAQMPDEVFVLPLYPQYAASSTETVIEEAKRCRRDLRFLHDFHDHPAYIEALARNVEEFWRQNGRNERLLMSFHGIPQKAVDRGDPYRDQCMKTGELLAKRLGLTAPEYLITFQSRFGAAKWLEPYTQDTAQRLGSEGITVDVICPGFVSDCLETLEEIAIEVKTAYLQAGGKNYRYIPALNEGWIEELAGICRENLGA